MFDLQTHEFAVSDPDLSCVPVPGESQDSIMALLDAYSLQWILKLDRARGLIARGGGSNTVLNKLDQFLDWLASLSADDIRSLFEKPVLMAWLSLLSRRARQIGSGADDTRQWFERHVSYLPIILLSRLDKIFGRDNASVAALIPSNYRISPLDLGWQFRATGLEPLAVELRPDGDNVTVWCDGAVIATIPREELLHQARGNGVRVNNYDGLVVEPRSFVVHGGVEVLPVEDYPELAERRLDEEKPWDRSLECLDIEFSRSIETIREVWPGCLRDLQAFWRGVFPMVMPTERWNSASTGDLPFFIQITVREGAWPYLLAESIIHEVSHVKLDLAMELAPLIENDTSKIYRHPWRPDLRPMSGVLLGAHAFLAVMMFYWRGLQLHPCNGHIQHEYELRKKEVGHALSILGESARFTAAGAELYARLRDAYSTH